MAPGSNSFLPRGKGARATLVFTIGCVGCFLALLAWSIPSHSEASISPYQWVREKVVSQTPITGGVSIVAVASAATTPAQTWTWIQRTLSSTVGPYEIIVVIPEVTDPRGAVVDVVVEQHRLAFPTKRGRGLVRYTRVIHEAGLSDDPKAPSPFSAGIAKASTKSVVLMDISPLSLSFGWDHQLKNALGVDENLLAVSGAACGKLPKSITAGQPIALINTDLSHIQHCDLVGRTPIMYSLPKLLALGGLSSISDDYGLGDSEACQRGAREFRWTCGFLPVITEPTIIPSFPLNLSKDSIDLLGLHSNPSRRLSDLAAIPAPANETFRTVVTAFSANHQKTAQGLYNSLIYSPNTRFIAYILPSDQEVDMNQFKSWENAEIRTFETSQHPDWMDVTVARGEYAWKAVIVDEIIKDFGGLVFWMDAGDRIERPLDKVWDHITKEGLWSTYTEGDIQRWTHPGQLAYLAVPRSLWDRPNCNAALIGINTLDATFMTRVIRKWIACSNDRACIAPPGSSRQNHRQDQAAFSCLVHQAGMFCGNDVWRGGHFRFQQDAEGEGSKMCDGKDC